MEILSIFASYGYLLPSKAERKSLEERISSLQDEMSRLTAKSKETRQTLEKERAAYAEDKRLLEDAIVDITHSEVSSRSDQPSREKEIREQMERAKASSLSTPDISNLNRL